MKQYLNLLRTIERDGRETGDRTGTGTKSIFGHQMRFDLREGFPVVTTKKIHLKSVIHELLWMLSGDTNIKYLKENGVRIWDEWADENGDLGPIYGAQWRNWNGNGIDQIKIALNDLRTNSQSRRIIVNAWNPSVLPDTSKSFDFNVANGKAALPPCHSFFQFKAYPLTTEEKELYPGKEEILHLQLYQRSADSFLGVPFNITFYALMLEIFSLDLNMVAGDFIHTLGDAHIYSNHREQVELQLSRELKNLPTVEINKRDSIFDYRFEDFKIINCDPHPLIKGKVAI